MRRSRLIFSSILILVLLLLAVTGALWLGSVPQRLIPFSFLEADLSPLPNYKGEFVSAGRDGQWNRPKSKFALGAVDSGALNLRPQANCSPEAIVHYAERAPEVFDGEKSGLLYGVKTHTSATRVGDMPGYNSCALVTHAILKKAGCKWARRTASAKAIYDTAYKHGWRPSASQEGGCIVAWNSLEAGGRSRIGRGKDAAKKSSGGVLFRHVGIATGSWWSVDNTSFLGRPTAGITTRPFRYESPIFLCPPKPRKK